MNGFSKTWTYLLSGNAVVFYSAYSSFKNKLCFAEWQSNWDKRNHIRGFSGANNYFLIRHGQYDRSNNPQTLSELGMEQAQEVGKYLNNFLARNPDLVLTSVVSSDLHRAIQTAQLAFVEFQDHLKDPNGVPPNEYGIKAYAGLNECDPYITERVMGDPTKFTDKRKKHTVLSRRILNNAASRIFKRPDHNEEQLHLVFAHATVNRYLLLHLLQLPCAAWFNFDYYHCGITWIRVDKDGFVTCKCFDDAGHFPKDLKTIANLNFNWGR